MKNSLLNYPFNKPEDYRITQLFGDKFIYRGKIVNHKGVDWAIPNGTILSAPFYGVVSRVEKTRGTGYGRSVYIRHQSNLIHFEVLLAHCSSIEVELGQSVKEGQIVAYSGRSGFWRGKNGYHVHLGLKRDDRYVDPLPYLGIESDDQQTLFPEPKTIQCKYTVLEGDSLYKIARAHYGSGKYYNEIFIANSKEISHPRIIKPGQVLVIPELDDKGV